MKKKVISIALAAVLAAQCLSIVNAQDLFVSMESAAEIPVEEVPVQEETLVQEETPVEVSPIEEESPVQGESTDIQETTDIPEELKEPVAVDELFTDVLNEAVFSDTETLAVHDSELFDDDLSELGDDWSGDDAWGEEEYTGSFALSTTVINFPDAEIGYMTAAIPPQELTVTNTGKVTLHMFMDNASVLEYFDITIPAGENIDNLTIEPGQSMTFSVLPMEGLTPGTWDDNIYVDAGEVAEYMTIPVTFTVVDNRRVLQKIDSPAAITGLPNGISPKDLFTKLPTTVNIVTNKGEMDVLVEWGNYAPNYNPANLESQTFEIKGRINLPSDVINPNEINEYVAISVTVNASPKLKTPTAPKISILEDRVKLNWAKVPKATSYTIYRKRGALTSKYDITTNNTYTDYEIFNGTQYTYYIVANANTYRSSNMSKGTTVTYLAKPASPTVRSTKTKTATVSWRKISRATGYQIRYSLKSNMSSAKTVKIGKAGTVKKVIKNLKRKKTYYFQIRVYKTVGSKTFYSVWSGKKKVRIK